MFSVNKALAQQKKSYYDYKTTFKPPEPCCGYSAFQDSIQYPESFRKGTVEASFIADIKIDTLGEIFSINFQPFRGCEFSRIDSMFIRYFDYKVKQLEWYPAVFEDKKIEFTVSIPVIYSLSDDEIQFYYQLRKIKNMKYRKPTILIQEDKPFIWD
jgi:hypothetical protein